MTVFKLDVAALWGRLERSFGWIAIPNIGLILITLQGLGFLMVSSDPAWSLRLALLPEQALAGEWWRLITFLALPLSTSFFWAIFVLWFLYFITSTIESEWGAFKTTLYVLTSVALMIVFSFACDYPITQIRHFESTLFLAAACLFPEFSVLLFFVVPVQMKWLGALTGILVVVEFFRSSGLDRMLLLAIYSNFILFFGPSLWGRLRLAWRRSRFRGRFGTRDGE